jgi:hypothetical protein
MKLTHLNTLPKRIDEIESLFINNKINSTKWRHLVMEHIDFLNEIVHIGLFVATKDGKLLEVPNSQCEGEVQKSCASANGCECYLLELRYNVAQQEVIFEGWELSHKTHGNYYIRNVSSGVELEFSEDNEITIRFDDHSHAFNYMSIKSIADLAEATQSNPLKLK